MGESLYCQMQLNLLEPRASMFLKPRECVLVRRWDVEQDQISLHVFSYYIPYLYSARSVIKDNMI